MPLPTQRAPRPGRFDRRRWVPATIVAAVICAVSILPGDAVGAPAPHVATAGHLAEFAVLGAVTTRASNARSRVLVALAVVFAVGLLTEAAQLVAIERSAELSDLAADLLGGLVGAGAWAHHDRARWGARSTSRQVEAGSLA